MLRMYGMLLLALAMLTLVHGEHDFGDGDGEDSYFGNTALGDDPPIWYRTDLMERIRVQKHVKIGALMLNDYET